MADLDPLPIDEPCLNFGRIVRIIRERIDGRSLEVVSSYIFIARSSLARIEVGETSPEKVTESFITAFLTEVKSHLKEQRRLRKKQARLDQLIDCLYVAYDCHQERDIEKKLQRVRELRKLREHGRK